MAKRSPVSTVTERGQVSIPAEIRRELDLHPGRRLLWRRAGEELRVRVLDDEPVGAEAVRGYVRRLRREPRSTASWMKELRSGEDG